MSDIDVSKINPGDRVTSAGSPDDAIGRSDDLEAKLAEAVRGRETALRDLRASERQASAEWERAEKAEAERDKARDNASFRTWIGQKADLNAARERIAELEADKADLLDEALLQKSRANGASDSYREVRTDLERAGSAYKSARQRAVEWKGTAEAFAEVVVPELNRKIKKLKKQRDKARNANDVRAADELEDLALEISALDWDVPGVTVGRAVQNLIRGRAAKLRGEK